MSKELLQAKRKGHNQKQENYEMKKLTGKGIHTVKIENHPHTKLVGSLKDKSSRNIHIHNKQLRDIQNNWM